VGNISKGPPVEFYEYSWSDRNNPSGQFTIGGDTGATGGGMSLVFPTPDYQTAVNVT
jgi:subtilase family serine protease